MLTRNSSLITTTLLFIINIFVYYYLLKPVLNTLFIADSFINIQIYLINYSYQNIYYNFSK